MALAALGQTIPECTRVSLTTTTGSSATSHRWASPAHRRRHRRHRRRPPHPAHLAHRRRRPTRRHHLGRAWRNATTAAMAIAMMVALAQSMRPARLVLTVLTAVFASRQNLPTRRLRPLGLRRPHRAHPHQPQHRQTAHSSTPSSSLCSDDTAGCPYTADGDCDDGGPGHDYDICAFGADCTDCGPREPAALPPSPPPPPSLSPGVLCSNSCTYATDGDCDDGGSGSEYELCDFGTDCTDCGSESATSATYPPFAPAPLPSPPTPSFPPFDASLCFDVCVHVLDGDCDDGCVVSIPCFVSPARPDSSHGHVVSHTPSCLNLPQRTRI